MKIYEILGLTEDDVVEMQTWLFSMMGKTDSIANMISCASDYFKDDMKRNYAIYLIGSETGQAKIKEMFGITHVLDPQNT